MGSFWELSNKKWEAGKDWIYINKLYWDAPELEKIAEALGTDWFAGNSKFNAEFEKELREFIGVKYFQTTNSGSSALEAAVQTIIQRGLAKSGDKVLHPILTFPTSISSSIMAGMVPVYADVGEGTYVIADSEIDRAFDKYPDIAYAVIPALLGNAPNVEKLLERLNGKPLILDSCDVMGTKWDEKEIGSYGSFAAYSFYGSHHISTFGVGGGLATNNPDFYETIKSLIFWGRDFATDGLSQIENFLRRYSYKTIGLDAQMSAVQAAFGLAQFQRLPEYLGQRQAIFRKLQNLFSRYLDYFILPTRVSDRADISWFCYPVTLTAEAPFSREFFAKYLISNKIEIRPIMAGNILNHVPYQDAEHLVTGNSRNADVVSRRGFFIPSCPMPAEQLSYYVDIVEKFLEKY